MISAVEISKSYSATMKALVKTSIQIEPGTVHVIMGKSGSGKSTLLGVLGGLIEPSSGSVRINGNDYYSLSDKERARIRSANFGYIFQSFQLIYELTVYDNIVMPLHITGQEIHEAMVYDLLKDLEIQQFMHSFPNELSGGQQQRVAIARAIIHKPKVIFADEPTGNLDSENANKIIHMLVNLCKKYNTTLLIVTHDEHLLANPDRVLFLKDGRVIKGEQ